MFGSTPQTRIAHSSSSSSSESEDSICGSRPLGDGEAPPMDPSGPSAASSSSAPPPPRPSPSASTASSSLSRSAYLSSPVRSCSGGRMGSPAEYASLTRADLGRGVELEPGILNLSVSGWNVYLDICSASISAASCSSFCFDLWPSAMSFS